MLTGQVGNDLTKLFFGRSGFSNGFPHKEVQRFNKGLIQLHWQVMRKSHKRATVRIQKLQSVVATLYNSM